MKGLHKKLVILHQSIDRQVAGLEKKHQSFLACKAGCSDCCQDGLTVFSVEANRIESFLDTSDTKLTVHSAGSCAFLHPINKSCQVYEARPYVCRTQGLPLRFIEESEEGLAEFRDICPLNDDPNHPIEELAAEDCWEIGPVEGELWRLALDEHGSDPVAGRVSLRELAEGRTL